MHLPARRHTRIRLRSLCVHRKAMTYDGCVELWWAEEDADYIRKRSARYQGALDLEPEWTREVMADEHLVELSPYPASQMGAPQAVCSW